jgi:GNAT superfamily N-acetyltransferase
MLPISMRQATLEDIDAVSEILSEAAAWLEQKNMVLWRETEIGTTAIARDLKLGLFYIAVCEGVAAGVVQFQLEDLAYWPDIDQSDSTFLHRLAVRRSFAGGNVSTQIFQWAIDRTQDLGRHFLRLDCMADRPRLRSIYENFGFKYHSDRQVGANLVARYEYAIGGC